MTPLYAAKLIGVRHLFTFNFIGHKYRKMHISIADDGDPMIILGCFSGKERTALAKIRGAYGKSSSYEQVVSGACKQARELLGMHKNDHI